MDSPTKECNNPDEITTPAPVAESDVEDKTSEVAPEGNDEVKTSPEISSEHKSEDEDTTIESFEDIDLGSIEIAANMLEEMEKSLKPSEAYENLMGACSSTAQALKQTISDVLRTRESIVITDSTSELEQSLSQKIADFETVVSGSFVTRDIKAELTNIKHPAFSNVIITEVDDSTEDANISDTNSNAQVIEEQKSSPNSTSVELNSEAETLPENTEVSSKDSTEVSSKKIDEKQKSEVKSTQTLPVQGFLCPFCFVPFPTGDILHNHCETSHSENLCEAPIPSDGRKDVYICPACKVKLGSEIDLQSHYAKQHASEKNEAETVPVVNSAVDDKKFKKQQKANSNKKKGEKTIDQILKSLSNYSTPDEKLQALCKKHVEALEEVRLMEPRMKQLERQVQSQQKEKEQLQADHNRMILAKSRLESLCRELQRQNKCVKEENLLRIKEEEEKRKEIANKFQSTLTDISALMQEHSKKNLQLREENAELAKKLKALVDHYDTWEKHMEKIVQQNHLEAQLAKAKHAKVNLVLKQETEKFLKEKQALLENMSELQKRCTLLTTNELKLRTELGDYTSKYEEFQTVLNKSSQVFASFKTDMEATSKKIKKLEKETNVYKQKWESSNNALLGMINDKQKHDKELINAQQRIATLEKLCRALQAERNELQNQLNAVTSSVNSSPNDVPSTPVET